MVKWICNLCGHVHSWPCWPAKCTNFARYGSCAPRTCQGCGAVCTTDTIRRG